MLVLRGGPSTAASVLFQGNVVFSLPETISIKRVTLRLYATLRLNWIDPLAPPRAANVKLTRLEKILYEQEWTNLEHSSTSSTTPLLPLSGTHTLHAGNHSLPFEAILPGSIDESVEGLEGAQVIYKLVATIERGRFANNLVAKRHIRVVRTLGPDALELCQTMSIENTWPDKVEYIISVPAKATALGSFTPLDFHLSPLLKGLKLGSIKVQLVEYKVLEAPSGLTNQTEKVVAEHVLPAAEDGLLGLDEWKFTEEFPMPTSLSKCTQDCEIESYIKVTHKLKFAVSLINPDGHTSELRASLPIYVFISPNVSITSLHPTLSGPSAISPVPSAHHSPSNSVSEHQLFSPLHDYRNAGATTPGGRQTPANLTAPPNYQDHIYDALWREIPSSQFESPIASGANTPFTRSRRNSIETHDNAGFGPHDSSQLLSNLYALQERQNREETGNITSILERPNSGFNLSSSGPTSSSYFLAAANSHSSRFSSRSTSGTSTPRETATPGYLQMTASSGSSHPHTPNPPTDYFNISHSPDFSHLSHPTSPTVGSSPAGSLDLESLSRVPSYQTAINSDTARDAECTPSYEEPLHLLTPGGGGGGGLSRHPGNNHSASASNIGGTSNVPFKRQFFTQPKPSSISAPGSSAHLSALSSQMARASVTPNNGDGSSAVSSSSRASETRSGPQSRSTSSTNLQSLNNGGGASSSSSASASALASASASGTSSSAGFFRSSSKTQLSSLNGGTSRLASGLTNANRSNSSRSLLDEASRFLHLHK